MCGLSVTTLSFDISVLELFHPLVHGGKVVLYEGLGAAMAAPTVDSAATAGTGIDMSLFFFGTGEDSDYRLLLDTARFGDEEGFAAIWTPERHFHAFGGPFPNPFGDVGCSSSGDRSHRYPIGQLRAATAPPGTDRRRMGRCRQPVGWPALAFR